MKTIEELRAELEEARADAKRWSRHKERNVGNCPSDLQNYDAAWRRVQSVEFQIRELIRAKQDACKHRWEESTFGERYWAPGTHQYTCRRCGKMSIMTIGVDHERNTQSSTRSD